MAYSRPMECKGFTSLVNELKADDSLSPLADSLEATVDALRSHWATNFLPWFTDHGVNHARRVAEYALNLARTPTVAAHLRLSSLERYILCTAALLHDVGMNDLELCARPLGSMLPEDFETVRHGHPKQSRKTILDDPDKWGLPDDDRLAELIALVAQAHGTKFYRVTLPLLSERHQVMNEEVRGELLAGILLMADELDLHYERSVRLPGNPVLNAVSEAHAFKHRCVVACTVVPDANGSIVISLRMALPDALEPEDKLAVEQWITGKLRRQIGLTEPAFEEGFARQVQIDRAIKVTHQSPLRVSLPPSVQAMSVIRSEAESDLLIDHRKPLARAEAALREHQIVVLLGEFSPTHKRDTDGREQLLRVLNARSKALGTLTLASSRLTLVGGGEASDVIQEWLIDVGESFIHDPDAVDESEIRDAYLNRLVTALSELAPQRILLSLASADLLHSKVFGWLLESAIPAVAAIVDGACAILVSANGTPSFPGFDAAIVTISLENCDRSEVAEFLSQYQPTNSANTESMAKLSYDHFREIAHVHAAEVIARSNR